MNIEISTTMLKHINDLYRSGLWGASPEEVVRRLVEKGLREEIERRANRRRIFTSLCEGRGAPE